MVAILLIVIAVVIIIVMLVIYIDAKKPTWGKIDYWKAQFTENPDSIWRRSSGTFDREANLAIRRTLDRLERDRVRVERGATRIRPIEERAQDHYRVATILHRSLVTQEPPGRDPHRNNELRHDTDIMTNMDVEQTQLRRSAFQQAYHHYCEAIAALTGEMLNREEQNRANNRLEETGRLGPGAADGIQPGAEFIIDAAIEFAFGGVEMLIGGDPLVNILFVNANLLGGTALFGGDINNLWETNLLGANLLGGGNLTHMAENRRNETITQRQAAARQITNETTPRIYAEAYLDLSQRHTDDPENSHDPSVNASLRGILKRLREEQPDLDKLPSLAIIEDYILQNSNILSLDPHTKEARPLLVTERAIPVIRRAQNGERHVAIGATDEEVLRRVWARAQDSGNKDKIYQAIFDALIDSWRDGIEGPMITCVNGRCSRVIGALSMLDHDERNWGVFRLEQLKNDIFEKAKLVIQVAGQEALESPDPEKQKVGRSYLASTPQELSTIGDIDESKDSEFVENTRARIGIMVDNHVAELNNDISGVIPSCSIEGIKKDAMGAL